MKKLTILFGFIICLPNFLSAQIMPFGLDGITVTDLRINNNVLYAATVDSGVFRRELSGTGWECLGLKEKWITSVYPYPFDTGTYSVTVGVYHKLRPGDSTYLFSLSDSGWIADDNGMEYSDFLYGISSIDGYVYNGGSHFMFAGGDWRIYKRSNLNWNSSGRSGAYVVKISNDGTVWIGGVANLLNPFIAKSTDKGDTWMYGDYEYWGDGEVSSLAFHPTDSNVL